MREISRDQNDPHRYDDMLKMEHHVSVHHVRMPLIRRAAQFSPFDALSGYDEAIKEAADIREPIVELSAEKLDELNERMQILKASEKQHPLVHITWRKVDHYVSADKKVQRVDIDGRKIVFTDHVTIPFESIYDLQSVVPE